MNDKKANTGYILQLNAIATDTLGLKVPKILQLLGIEVDDRKKLNRMIEVYGNLFYEWMVEYLDSALPSTDGALPESVHDDAELKSFIIDLMMNFYIARMLLVELLAPTNDDEE